MAWKTPKTDWKPSDYINIGDYNRWIGNIKELGAMANEVYASFSIGNLGSDKTYSDYIYADEINAIENDLEAICRNTYPFPIGSKKLYYPNQATLNYAEINRIESACKLIHEQLQGQINGRPLLEFTLNGGIF